MERNLCNLFSLNFDHLSEVREEFVGIRADDAVKDVYFAPEPWFKIGVRCLDLFLVVKLVHCMALTLRLYGSVSMGHIGMYIIPH